MPWCPGCSIERQDGCREVSLLAGGGGSRKADGKTARVKKLPHCNAAMGLGLDFSIIPLPNTQLLGKVLLC
jgi:hypothetical protein